MTRAQVYFDQQHRCRDKSPDYSDRKTSLTTNRKPDLNQAGLHIICCMVSKSISRNQHSFTLYEISKLSPNNIYTILTGKHHQGSSTTGRHFTDFTPTN